MSCNMGETCLQSVHAQTTTSSSVSVPLKELPEDKITLLEHIADTICSLPAPERARLKRDSRSNASAKAEPYTVRLSYFTLAPKRGQESKASEQLIFKLGSKESKESKEELLDFEIDRNRLSDSQKSALNQVYPQALEPKAKYTRLKDDRLFWSLLSAYDSILTTGTVSKAPAKFDAATQNKLLGLINDDPRESPLLSWEQYKAQKASGAGAGTGTGWNWLPLSDDGP